MIGESKISVRSFAWHDFISFYRYRRQVVCTDSAQALTHGSPTTPLGFLSRLNPKVGIYTGVAPSKNGSIPVIGQVQYSAGDRSAHIVFLMPDEALNQPNVSELLDRLAVQAGAWGAFHLLAEVEENNCALERLRQSGFSVYAWQRIWNLPPAGIHRDNSNGSARAHKNGHARWQQAASVDEVMIRSLYQSLVPPLVQSAEPLSSRRLLGWVYRQEGEILAYVEGIHGPHGIYLQPLVHPGVENVSHVLADLLAGLRNPMGRPVYIAVRSYQAWLETVMRDLECQVGPRQALMVKHLVIQQRVAVHNNRHSVLEKYTAEPTVPLVNNTMLNK